MSTMFFMVTVEVERESGLFASREDLSTKISEAIQEAESNADLSGLGANSDSQYNVTAFDVEELEAKERKQVYAEYDALVVAEMPGDAELRDTVKRLKAELKTLEGKLSASEGKVAALVAEQNVGKTRVWQDDSIRSSLDGDGPRTYLQDGIHDFVKFAYGERWDERFDVSLTKEGHLTVRANSMGEFVVRPIHSQEVEIRVLPR